PNLNRMARQGALFDSVYAPIPASVRSLIAIHTGGRGSPLGGSKEMTAQYYGPTLPAQFHDLGYSTAFFSSERLDGEYSDIFLGRLGFTHLYDFAQDPKAHLPEYSIPSWGAKEFYTLGLMEDWIAAQRAAGRPFLMEYYTAATHHPYGAPADFPALRP